jgi:hypothetical protein
MGGMGTTALVSVEEYLSCPGCISIATVDYFNVARYSNEEGL